MINIFISLIMYQLWMMCSDDHSRVVLDVTEGSLQSDYVNASYIDVCNPAIYQLFRC